jgi:ribosomal protein S18 acetylase RimI-like enzyme
MQPMIRPATRADVPALTALVGEVHEHHRAARPDRYADPRPDQIAALLERQLADPRIAILVAHAGAELAGYAVVCRVGPMDNIFVTPRVTAHVDQLGVRAGDRRSGHGRALMAAVEDLARSWAATSVTLDVQSFNAGAEAFYRAIGYAASGARMSRRIDG